jgi:hypothetical protein
MFALGEELRKVKSASLPVADQIALAEEFVARKAAVGRPMITIVRDAMSLNFADDVVTTRVDVITLLCWLAPATVLMAIEAEIKQGPPPVNSLSAAVRIKKIAELSGRLLELERLECALLDDSILPRHDMSALAYLQIAIRQEADASVAA